MGRKHFPEEFTREVELKRLEREREKLEAEAHRQAMNKDLGSVFKIEKNTAEEAEIQQALIGSGVI